MVDITKNRLTVFVALAIFVSTGLSVTAVGPTPKAKPSSSSVRASQARLTNSQSLADNGKKTSPRNVVPVDRQTETKAMELVRMHLPELGSVLQRLRSDRSPEYDRAVRDLARSARKLEAAKNRDERLYDLEVELLKSQNEVNLLTAKLKVRDSERDRKLLHSGAGRLQQAQFARDEYYVQLYRQRLERFQNQLEATEAKVRANKENPEQKLEKSYLSLLRKAGRDQK